ncbi:LTA synthase family protein [Haloarcula marina]|uniref:LTA synthase family protein n=1 Tax=Haloarcula marina TaxID=2961574 RepID=UPI0020B89F2A|nr:LTA synthase family protein [Halomicroarcula marina]
MVESVKNAYSAIYTARNGEGVDVIAEDWDNLVIIDACRYDDFERENTLGGELEPKISRGRNSLTFIRENFVGRELQDTVYVTGNSFVKELSGDEFHFVNVDPLKRNIESYDGYVSPEAVTQAALDTHERFPNKRLIVHYMQPHDPPIGEVGDRIEEEFGITGWHPDDDMGQRLMPAVEQGDVPVEIAREGYRENLRIVLAEVERLLSEIDGRSVITSDHGEMFGERPYFLLGRRYGHMDEPRNRFISQVPWFVVDDDSDRRKINSSPPTDTSPLSSEEVKSHLDEHLEMLGYK